MIEAVSHCPSCALQYLPVEPQPPLHGTGRRKEPRKRFYTFYCNCGKAWLADMEETELMYRWCKQVGLLHPTEYVKANEISDVTGSRLGYIHRRLATVLTRLG